MLAPLSTNLEQVRYWGLLRKFAASNRSIGTIEPPVRKAKHDHVSRGELSFHEIYICDQSPPKKVQGIWLVTFHLLGRTLDAPCISIQHVCGSRCF
jgi:hypothetical protein